MSDARISPSVPEPLRVEISTPSSFARRRAFGEILAVEAGLDAPTPEPAADFGTSFGTSLFLGELTRAVGAGPEAPSVGGCSPGAAIQAMVCPTGISAPSEAFTPARTPSAGASTSTTALSVSISSRGSPLVTRSPSFFRQAMSLPVSCAISSAGMTTLKGMVVFRRPSGTRFSVGCVSPPLLAGYWQWSLRDQRVWRSQTPTSTVSASGFLNEGSIKYQPLTPDANRRRLKARDYLETSTRSVLALDSIISSTCSLGGASLSRVVGSGPLTVK